MKHEVVVILETDIIQGSNYEIHVYRKRERKSIAAVICM